MAGIWYRRGTVSLTNGSAVVDGAGVTWNDPAGGVQVGNIFFGPDGEAYEVAYVLSATQLQLASNYKGPTATAQPYAIVTPIVGSIPALSTKVAAVLAFVEGQYDSLDAWAHGGENETVTITSPISGETVTVPTLAKMGKDYEAVSDALPAAIRAETAAATATTKAGEASTSADTATTKANEASASAVAANTAKNSAVAAADTAATKAVEAATSAASAKTDADRAEQAAQVVVGSIIDAGSYNAGSGVLPAPISVGGSVRSCMWKVVGAGTAGGIELGVGDSLVYTTSDSSYYKIDNTESVTSVNGKKGVVSITASDVGADPSGASSAAITQHEAKAGAHSIAGVNGLQAALDSKEPSGATAAAVAAHKSGADQHPISGVTGLQTALDNLAKNSGDPVLSAKWVQKRSAMWTGFAAGDGQELSRTLYPDAWAAINAGLVPVCTKAEWIADPAKRGCFHTGDGSTTFGLPDYNGVYPGSYGPVYLGGGTADGGAILQDRIQNITGKTNFSASPGGIVDSTATATGAFKVGSTVLNARPGETTTTGRGRELEFDASLVARTGETTRPITAEGCIAIKLFGAVQNTGSADAAALATAVAALAARVTALEARKFTTLIPATYPSGAPHDTHETVDAALPANIAANTRYVLTNPFGVNTRVHVTVELYLNGKWADPGHDGNTGTGTASGGTVGHHVQGEGIIIQTGTVNVASQSALFGGGHGITSTASITSAPCRVAIRKWEE